METSRRYLTRNCEHYRAQQVRHPGEWEVWRKLSGLWPLWQQMHRIYNACSRGVRRTILLTGLREHFFGSPIW